MGVSVSGWWRVGRCMIGRGGGLHYRWEVLLGGMGRWVAVLGGGELFGVSGSELR